MSVEKHILGYVRQEEQKTQAKGDTNPYDACCNQMSSVDLGQITAEQVKRIVERFLVEWGWMSRVLGHPRYNGWQTKLAATIRNHAVDLKSARALDLANQELSSNRSAIKDCYNSFRTDVGPTSAAKVLHLVAPNYFPPWDDEISKLAWRCPRTGPELKKGQRRRDGGGYYFFMLQIQHFLKTYLGVWEQLATEFHRTQVKMIDRYLWQNEEPLAWFDLDPQQ
jgi:hypothetical protein